mgnify:CR=1 FL=1
MVPLAPFKVNELDNRGTNYYIAKHWAAAMAKHDDSFAGLAAELAAYYAPLPCEDRFVLDLQNHARRKETQRARRKRWATLSRHLYATM